jgi:hypothetical protein
MAKLRSPNYPNRNLEAALGLVQKIYDEDERNKISRVVMARHMGHDSLSGPALGKLGALRAYGLIEGAGDELRVTEDAIAAIMAPLGSDARRESVRRLALNPVLFQDIRKQFTGKVSIESLTYWLIQNGFIQTAAPIAARTYFETMEFAGGLEADTDTTVSIAADTPRPRPPVRVPPGYPSDTPSGSGGYEGERARPVGDAGAPFRITMDGKKLHIMADVDLAQLQVLKQMLDSYENMLKILSKPAGQAKRPLGVFQPGEKVPVGGNYWVHHPNGHAEDQKVILHEGGTFRPCETCGNEAVYKQVQILE